MTTTPRPSSPVSPSENYVIYALIKVSVQASNNAGKSAIVGPVEVNL